MNFYSFTSGIGINVATLHAQSSDNPIPVYGGNGVAGYTKNYLKSEPTVVIGRVGQKCGEVYFTNGLAWITDNALYPRVISQKLDIRFLSLALKSAGLNNFRNQNDLPLVTQAILHSVIILLPPTKAEQEAIACTLSDIDALIESLDRLLTKKRQIKQGTIQELLRSTEIDEEKKLSEISTLKGRIGWQGLKQTEFTTNEDEPFLITGMNFKDGSIQWGEVYHISEERYEIAKEIQLKPDDVLMTKDGTIGKMLYVDRIPFPRKASLNSHLLLFRPIRDSYYPKYLYYQLNSKRFKDFIELNKSGTTFFGISQESVGNYDFLLPPIERQIEIANILSDMDAEIGSIESKLTKTRQLKQGMMHELLTGRIRLVDPIQ